MFYEILNMLCTYLLPHVHCLTMKNVHHLLQYFLKGKLKIAYKCKIKHKNRQRITPKLSSVIKTLQRKEREIINQSSSIVYQRRSHDQNLKTGKERCTGKQILCRSERSKYSDV